MLVLARWLKELVPFEADYKEVADNLTMAGLEVEGVYNAFPSLHTSILSCRVDAVSPIEGSARLKVAKVFDGEGTWDVVCGAPNVRPGMMTVLAKVGAELPGGLKIGEKEIRGVKSMGMLCSQRELLIGDDAKGIMDLSGLGVHEPGVPVADFIPLDDTVFEIGITPNRADCLSILGVAREVGALFKVPLNVADIFKEADKGKGRPSQFPVTIEAPESCMRYMGCIIKGVRVGDSPHWLQFKLLSMGIRPINNVVDCTNLCLLELGQPLHAFDLSRLKGPEIRVRHAHDGETIETLDHKTRALTPDMLVIADAERPVAVAGVMGGANSEVDASTVDILLESAWFEPNQIRRTRKALKLNTEASYRFERWVDPEIVPMALRRCARLIVELAGGEIQGEVDQYPKPYKPRTVTFRPHRVQALCGVEVSEEEQVEILGSIGFKRVGERSSSGKLTVWVPSYRFDVNEEIDIVEEVARLKGFSEIPVLSPRGELVSQDQGDDMPGFLKNLKEIMVEQGVFEVISYSFCSRKELSNLGFPPGHEVTDPVPIMNPLSDDYAVMRTSLVPGLLQAVSRNLARMNWDLRLFEQGRCFFKDASSPTGVREEERLMCVLTGRRLEESWAWESAHVDVFDIKGILENALERLRIHDWSLDQGKDVLPYYSEACFAYLLDGTGKTIGWFGELSQEMLRQWEIEAKVYALELLVDSLYVSPIRPKSMRPLPKYPASDRDVAIVLDQSITYREVMEFIRSKAQDLLEDVFVFDVYKGKQIPKGKKSLALRFVYRAQDRTLTDEEITTVHQGLVDALLERFQGELRK